MQFVLAVLFGLMVIALFGLAVIEASLLHVRRSAVASTAQGDARSRALLRLLEDLPRVMNAVLLAVLFVQVTATSVAGLLARRWFGDAGITAATVSVTIVLFVYGEAIPKTIAVRRPLHYARKLVGATRLLDRVLAPIVIALLWIARKQSPIASDVVSSDAASERELLHIASDAVAAGHIESSDAELIEQSFTLGDLTAADVLVPLDDVAAIPHDATVARALETALHTDHRHLPVHRAQRSDLVGVIRLRDVAARALIDPSGPLAGHIVKTVTVETDTRALEALRSMQTADRQLAFVADSSGTVIGILTVEDILNEFLG